MKKLLLLLLLSFPCYLQAQKNDIVNIKFKTYIPSITFTFLGGLSDGLRDASLFRMDGYNRFWNGKQSMNNKYRNGDINQGPAYFGSTTFLVWTTDGAHLSNMITHQFSGMAVAFMPPDNNRKLGHIILKVLSYNLIRQAGHTIMYDIIFKP